MGGPAVRQSRLLRCEFLATVLAALVIAPGGATGYKGFHDREIIHEADLVIEGTVTAIIGPAEMKGDKRPGYSVAVIRIEKVFKGDVKVGAELRMTFWSRQGVPPNKWEDP